MLTPAFKDPDNQHSWRERSDNAAWWDRLIDGENGVELKLTPSVMDPERSILWLRKRVAKTLYLAIQYGFAEEICRYLAAVWGKSTKTEKQKWADYAERCGKDADDEE